MYLFCANSGDVKVNPQMAQINADLILVMVFILVSPFLVLKVCIVCNACVAVKHFFIFDGDVVKQLKDQTMSFRVPGALKNKVAEVENATGCSMADMLMQATQSIVNLVEERGHIIMPFRVIPECEYQQLLAGTTTESPSRKKARRINLEFPKKRGNLAT